MEFTMPLKFVELTTEIPDLDDPGIYNNNLIWVNFVQFDYPVDLGCTVDFD